MDRGTVRVVIGVTVLVALAIPGIAHAQSGTWEPTPEQTAAWQQEIAAAEAKRASGHWITAAGGGLAVAGALTAVRTLECTTMSCSSARPVAGVITEFAGLAVMGFGDSRAHDAIVELKWLNRHGPTPLPQTVWQGEHEYHVSRRSFGRRMEYIGLGAAAGGTALLATGSRCLEGCGHGALLMAFAGAGLSGAGLQIRHDADTQLRLLERHRPGPAPNVALGSQDHPLTLGVAPGRTTSVTGRISW